MVERKDGRVRWSAIGAAIAVTIGSGGMLTAGATLDGGERATFVPITPCRVMDTRPGADNVGPRATPLGPGDTHTILVHGTNGNCTIPTDAVGVVMNVAAINPTAGSFLTVFPAGVSRPLAANLNWVAGQPPLSNAVTADLSPDGRLSFFNLGGTVDVAADIVGYFADHTHDDRYVRKDELGTLVPADHTHDDRYYTEAESDARFFEGATLRLVPADGTPAQNGALLEQTIASIVDASAAKPYTVRLAPGVFDVGNDGMVMSSFVDLEGSGRGRTVITGSGSTDQNPFDGGRFATVHMAADTSLRDLTVRNTAGPGTMAIGVLLRGSRNVLDGVAVEVVGGATATRASAVAPDGGSGAESTALIDSSLLQVDSGTVLGALSTSFGDLISLEVRNSQLVVTAGGAGIGTEFGFLDTSLLVTDSTIDVDGGGAGVGSISADSIVFDNIRITVTGGSSAIGLAGNGSGFRPVLSDSTVIVSGASGGNNIGLSTNNGTIVIQNSTIDATNIALRVQTQGGFTARYTVEGSVLSAATGVSFTASGAHNIKLATTQIDATTNFTVPGGSLKCQYLYDENFDPVVSCP